MSQYYILREWKDLEDKKCIYPQVVGTYPSEVAKKCDNRLLEFVPQLTFELDNKTQLTDFISYNGSYLRCKCLLVSEKALLFLQGFSLPEHVVYPVTIEHKRKKVEYFLFLPIRIHNDVIDYQKTQFYIEDRLSKTRKTIQPTDEKDFDQKRLKIKPLETIKTIDDRIYFVEKHIMSLDLVLLMLWGYEFYISSELRESLLSSDLTGYEVFSSVHEFLGS